MMKHWGLLLFLLSANVVKALAQQNDSVANNETTLNETVSMDELNETSPNATNETTLNETTSESNVSNETTLNETVPTDELNETSPNATNETTLNETTSESNVSNETTLNETVPLGELNETSPNATNETTLNETTSESNVSNETTLNETVPTDELNGSNGSGNETFFNGFGPSLADTSVRPPPGSNLTSSDTNVTSPDANETSPEAPPPGMPCSEAPEYDVWAIGDIWSCRCRSGAVDECMPTSKCSTSYKCDEAMPCGNKTMTKVVCHLEPFCDEKEVCRSYKKCHPVPKQHEVCVYIPHCKEPETYMSKEACEEDWAENGHAPDWNDCWKGIPEPKWPVCEKVKKCWNETVYEPKCSKHKRCYPVKHCVLKPKCVEQEVPAVCHHHKLCASAWTCAWSAGIEH